MNTLIENDGYTKVRDMLSVNEDIPLTHDEFWDVIEVAVNQNGNEAFRTALKTEVQRRFNGNVNTDATDDFWDAFDISINFLMLQGWCPVVMNNQIRFIEGCH